MNIMAARSSRIRSPVLMPTSGGMDSAQKDRGRPKKEVCRRIRRSSIRSAAASAAPSSRKSCSYSSLMKRSGTIRQPPAPVGTKLRPIPKSGTSRTALRLSSCLSRRMGVVFFDHQQRGNKLHSRWSRGVQRFHQTWGLHHRTWPRPRPRLAFNDAAGHRRLHVAKRQHSGCWRWTESSQSRGDDHGREHHGTEQRHGSAISMAVWISILPARTCWQSASMMCPSRQPVITARCAQRTCGTTTRLTKR